jgi:hypothetical protein
MGVGSTPSVSACVSTVFAENKNAKASPAAQSHCRTQALPRLLLPRRHLSSTHILQRCELVRRAKRPSRPNSDTVREKSNRFLPTHNRISCQPSNSTCALYQGKSTERTRTQIRGGWVHQPCVTGERVLWRGADEYWETGRGVTSYRYFPPSIRVSRCLSYWC